MATSPMKLQFEEAHPHDWDAFNAWTAGPTAVTRADAARGLRGLDVVAVRSPWKAGTAIAWLA
jgi:hypothetical protein